jgi:hypothetical protein
MLPFLALLFGLSLSGQNCPHQGSDHRLLGRVGCPIQRKLTIENARPPRTIWSFHLLKVSVKIDPKRPHLMIEWPARSQRLWRFRVGYRWDANAKAYIFPALSLKRVDGRCTSTKRTRNGVQERLEGRQLMCAYRDRPGEPKLSTVISLALV